MTARSFSEIMRDGCADLIAKNPGLSAVHIPAPMGSTPKPGKAKSFKDALAEMKLGKGFKNDQPRDENGRWVAGGTVLATFSSSATAHGTLNGVEFASWTPPSTMRGWADVDGQANIDEPEFVPVEGKHNGAGVIIKEPDGRVWMVKPANGYGGYKGTFPKGTQDEGLSLQATAIKEAYEESGLKVKITGFAADVERDTSKARYYYAERVGGTPSDHGPESEAVVLVPPARAHEILNRAVDRKLAHEVIGAPKPPPEEKKGWHGSGSKSFEDSWGFKAPQYGNKKSSAAMQLALGSWAGMDMPKGASPKGSTGYTSIFDAKPKVKKAASFRELVDAIAPRAVSFDYIAKATQVGGNLCRGPDGKFVACGILAAGPKGGGESGASPQAASNLAHAALFNTASMHGLPTPDKAVGSAANMSGHYVGGALLAAAKNGDSKALMAFIDAKGSAQNTYAKAQVAYAKKLLAHTESKKFEQMQAKIAEEDATPKTGVNGLKDVSGWKKVGGQLGSNPGGVYVDEAGQKWYVKQSKSDDHAKNEHLAGVLYKMAGAPTTEPELVDVGGGKLGIATKWKEKDGFNKDKNDHAEGAKAHFAAHAWLANYDAVGASFDNQAVIDGKVTTVDVGGALIYRAQGAPKTDFGEVPKEWHSMRDPKINPNAAAVFGDMDAPSMFESADAVGAISDKAIHEAVMKHGPGGMLERNALANKLIARKKWIASEAEHLSQTAGLDEDEVAPDLAKPQRVKNPKPEPDAVKPALPKFEAHKLPATNTNAASHNAKVEAIKALAEAGNTDAILALKFGTNTYAKQQAKLANAALAALGSDQSVIPGQKKGEHPAVSGKAWAVAAATTADKTEVQAPKAQAKFEPQKLSKPPSFSNWQGSGKGLSSKAENNAANDAEVNAIHALASKGDLAAIKAYTVKSPSKHVMEYKSTVEAEIDEMLNPPEPLKLLNHSGGDLNSLSKALAGKPLGTTVHNVKSNEKVGYFIALGVAKTNKTWADWEKTAKPLSSEFVQKAPSIIAKLSPAAKAAVGARQAGNSWADKVREGKLGDKHGNHTVGAMAKALNAESVELPMHTKLYRYFSMPAASVAKMKNIEPGTVLQDMNPACTTYKSGATAGFGSHSLEIITAPGAKAMPSFGSGNYTGEYEVTMQAGWRMMVMDVQEKGGGKLNIKAVLLPPP